MDWTRLSQPPGSRVAVVGGAGAIGRKVVEACLANEHKVAVLDLPRSLEAFPPPKACLTLPIDATDPKQIEAAFAKLDADWHALDALVFLVGFTITPPTKLDAITIEQWDDVIAGNLRTGYLVARSAVPLLMKGKDATIVNVSSGLGVSVLPGFGPYAAAKAGLIGLTKALAVECGPRIRANAVAPAAIETAFMKGGTGRQDDMTDGAPPWFKTEEYARMLPLQRVTTIDDVVGPVLFLMGPKSGFITGQTIHINGGRFMP